MNVKHGTVIGIATLTLAASVFAGNDLAEMREKIEKAHAVKAMDKFYGFDRIVFDFYGHDAWVVCPKGESRPGKPWTWTIQWATSFVPRAAYAHHPHGVEVNENTIKDFFLSF